ncbi:MAG: prolipoprotein diacylglyceryl transferase [Bacilli bacterium]|nr:prolipoprotein diacylglyceryl transferase [Bacilli bacterium]
MINLVLAIIFTVLGLGLFGFSIYKSVTIVKNPSPKTINYKNEVLKISYLVLAIGISSVLAFLFMSKNNGYNISTGEYFELIFGGFLFGVALPSLIDSFIIHYYGKEIEKKIDKILFTSLISSIFVGIIGLWLVTNSFADDLRYPLVNGFSFKNGLSRPDISSVSGEFRIQFYALFILAGAILVYFVCDHRFYKEYGEHGILESTFYVAFPAGIIGARIGFVIGEWETKFKGQPFVEVFKIWNGGLTIIWGALIGIIAGVIWFKTRKKQYNLWLAIDVIVPAILLAQAVGRIGNFFNCEVHGLEVSAEAWRFLPKIVLNNMTYSTGQGIGYASSGNIFLPLFFIEGIINLAGYFVIRYAFGKGLKKYIELGDLGALYLVWYGYTRTILEPLRHPSFNMGKDGYWSWIWSLGFIFGGMLLICANHVVRYYLNKKKNNAKLLNLSCKSWLISTISIFAVGLILVVIGSIVMSQNTYSKTIGLNAFNNGLIVLVSGVSIWCLLGVTLPSLIDKIKYAK